MFKNQLAYTIELDGNSQGKILKFSGPSNGEKIYVVHHGLATVQRSVQGSVGLNQLAPQLKSFTTDVFSGNGSATQFTMSEAPTGGSEMVFVDGILQKSSTNYGVSGTTLTFTSQNARVQRLK